MRKLLWIETRSDREAHVRDKPPDPEVVEEARKELRSLRERLGLTGGGVVAAALFAHAVVLERIDEDVHDLRAELEVDSLVRSDPDER